MLSSAVKRRAIFSSRYRGNSAGVFQRSKLWALEWQELAKLESPCAACQQKFPQTPFTCRIRAKVSCLAPTALAYTSLEQRPGANAFLRVSAESAIHSLGFTGG
jgi:hypothetical protein